MASWMVHLRIGDILLDKLDGLDPEAFIVGNIAPDSGVPNEDWTSFSPPTSVSHFKTQGKKADAKAFAAKYLTKEKYASCEKDARSFYLGYLVHLMTDVAWSQQIVHPSLDKHLERSGLPKQQLIGLFKEDWYDLDFLYLQEHPNFRSFLIYREADGFQNRFMEEFSESAFDNRRQYITGFYSEEKEGLDRSYPYLTRQEMDRFVISTADNILRQINGFLP